MKNCRGIFRTLLVWGLWPLCVAVFPGSSHAEDLLSTIKNKGVLTVGTEARLPPFEFVENGKILGYSADMLSEIMKGLPGVRVERLDLPWQGILPGLTAKRFDYVVTSVTVTKERFALYRFSLPVADATMALMKRKGDGSIMKPQDVSGKAVGAEAGSAMLQAAQTLSSSLVAEGKAPAAIKSYTDFSEAYADLGAGRTQAVVNSLPALLEADAPTARSVRGRNTDIRFEEVLRLGRQKGRRKRIAQRVLRRAASKTSRNRASSPSFRINGLAPQWTCQQNRLPSPKSRLCQDQRWPC